MNTIFIYDFDNFLCQGIVPTFTDSVTAIQCSVPSGIPFLVINEKDLLIDEIFFDCGYADFSNPDGYGYGHMSMKDLKKYKLDNEITDELIIQEIQKPKDRKIKLNINKCKDVWKNKLRIDRQPMFADLDVAYIRSLETNDQNALNKILKKKQLLRDITADPRIEQAQTVSDLKQIIIPINFIQE